MICLNCKKQIPDSAASCPYCGNQIIHKEQLPEELKFRRYQRWFFYGIIAVVFLGMLGFIIKIYNANTNYLTQMNELRKTNQAQLEDLGAKAERISSIEAEKEMKSQEVAAKTAELEALKADLLQKTEDYKKVLDEKVAVAAKNEDYESALTASDANIYNLIIKLGVGVADRDIARIMTADSNFFGMDTDGDGLPDAVEGSFGTDKAKPDTDGDGFNDKDEILGGYNPNGEGRLPIDPAFADAQKGKILLQVEGRGEAWYVSPGDGKRYFLGTPADAFRTMRDLDYWTKDWKVETAVEPAEVSKAEPEPKPETIVEPSLPAMPNQRIGGGE